MHSLNQLDLKEFIIPKLFIYKYFYCTYVKYIFNNEKKYLFVMCFVQSGIWGLDDLHISLKKGNNFLIVIYSHRKINSIYLFREVIFKDVW